jgi:hypothetical protein
MPKLMRMIAEFFTPDGPTFESFRLGGAQGPDTVWQTRNHSYERHPKVLSQIPGNSEGITEWRNSRIAGDEMFARCGENIHTAEINIARRLKLRLFRNLWYMKKKNQESWLMTQESSIRKMKKKSMFIDSARRGVSPTGHIHHQHLSDSFDESWSIILGWRSSDIQSSSFESRLVAESLHTNAKYHSTPTMMLLHILHPNICQQYSSRVVLTSKSFARNNRSIVQSEHRVERKVDKQNCTHPIQGDSHISFWFLYHWSHFHLDKVHAEWLNECWNLMFHDKNIDKSSHWRRFSHFWRWILYKDLDDKIDVHHGVQHDTNCSNNNNRTDDRTLNHHKISSREYIGKRFGNANVNDSSCNLRYAFPISGLELFHGFGYHFEHCQLCRLGSFCEMRWCDVMWCDVMWCDVMPSLKFVILTILILTLRLILRLMKSHRWHFFEDGILAMGMNWYLIENWELNQKDRNIQTLI